MIFSLLHVFLNQFRSTFFIAFLILFFSGLVTPSYVQCQKVSKQELRIVQIDSIFDNVESMGFDTKGMLRYEYYFTDPTRNQLESLSEKLEKDTFETTSLQPKEDKKWHLRLKKNEIHSRESMYELEKRFRWLIYSFIVDDYDGFTISPADINAFIVPGEKFVSFIKSLENEPLFTVATNLIRKNAYDRAMVAFQECIDRHFKEDTSNFQLGNALITTHEFVKGIEYWEQARNINPHYLEAFIKLGTIFFENSHFNRALYNFQKADALKPNDDDILYNIAKCLLQLKRYNESYLYAKRALKLNRKNAFAKGVLDILKQSAVRKLRKLAGNGNKKRSGIKTYAL